MAERMDHLIERAAARLAGAMPLPAAPEAAVPGSAKPEAELHGPARATGFAPLVVPAPNLPPDRGAAAAIALPDPGTPVVTMPATSLLTAGPAAVDLLDQAGGRGTGPDAAAAPERAPPGPLPLPVPLPLSLADPAGGATLARAPGPEPAPAIPMDALERAGLVVGSASRTRISEEYRIAVGRILRVLREEAGAASGNRLLMVTSTRPGEGKTFTALNLAASLAQQGGDGVILVDVDPKIRPLSAQLGIDSEPGLLDLAADPSLRPEDLLRRTAIPTLSILPVGTRVGAGIGPGPDGTAAHRPLVPAITRLARRFPKHLIVLDTPPCLSTSDPHAIAPFVAQTVLVVEAERTQRSEVEAAMELLRGCASVTLLLNKVQLTTSHTFGAYDYFGSYS